MHTDARRALTAAIIGMLLTLGVAAPVAAAYDHHHEDGALRCDRGEHLDDNGECVYKNGVPGPPH